MANLIYKDLQTMSQPSPWVELFTLDTTVLGGTIYYFTRNIYANSNSIIYQANTYLPIPVQMSGMEVMAQAAQGSSGSSSQPRPSFSISNVNRYLLGVVISLNDLIGAKLTRMRTFEKYLDGQPNASTTEYIGPDTFRINQKTSHTKNMITWTLSSVIDIPGQMLPARQVIRDPTPLNPSGFPGVSQY